MLHQKENIQIVFENVTKDNKIITCEWYNTPLVDENEKIIGVASLMMDITERKKAEKAVRDSEERSKKLSNLTFEGIFIHDKGVCIDINESLLKLVGYSKEEIIGKNMIELSIPKKYHSMIKENMNRNNTKPYEIEARKKDGILFPIEVESRITKYNDIRVTAIRDITERKKAEEKKVKTIEFANKKTFEENIISVQKEHREVEQKRWETEKSLDVEIGRAHV